MDELQVWQEGVGHVLVEERFGGDEVERYTVGATYVVTISW